MRQLLADLGQLFFRKLGKTPDTRMNNFDSHTALLGNEGRHTIFSFGCQRLKFVGLYSLGYYDSVKSWDAAYLAVMVKYSHDEAQVEKYIDLEPVLEHLLIDKKQFLAPIQKVEVAPTTLREDGIRLMARTNARERTGARRRRVLL